jgi:hypothetical protein
MKTNKPFNVVGVRSASNPLTSKKACKDICLYGFKYIVAAEQVKDTLLLYGASMFFMEALCIELKKVLIGTEGEEVEDSYNPKLKLVGGRKIHKSIARQVAAEFNIKASTLADWRRRRLTDSRYPRYHKMYPKMVYYIRSEFEADLATMEVQPEKMRL